MWIVIQNSDKTCFVIDDSVVESFYISQEVDTVVFKQEPGTRRAETMTGEIVGVYSSLRCAHRVARLKVHK